MGKSLLSRFSKSISRTFQNLHQINKKSGNGIWTISPNQRTRSQNFESQIEKLSLPAGSQPNILGLSSTNRCQLSISQSRIKGTWFTPNLDFVFLKMRKCHRQGPLLSQQGLEKTLFENSQFQMWEQF